MTRRLAFLLAALTLPAAAQVPADLAPEGRRIAQQWCAACHAIGPGQPPPQGDATPPFPLVAAMPATTETSLRVFLQTPHVGMPNFQLSRVETDALVAYILSLRR
jgi:mono/diheme cytochrome c family protein